MNRGGVRSLALFAVLTVFSLLLVSGGPRLIGHAEEKGPKLIEVPVPRFVALSQAPQRAGETGLAGQGAQQLHRRFASSVRQGARPPLRVVSDANGNVLCRANYLHAVYQAFSLGDGFV